jgi:hypothetical protein
MIRKNKEYLDSGFRQNDREKRGFVLLGKFALLRSYY